MRYRFFGGKRKSYHEDGYRFDSAGELKRYGELKLLEKAGEISFLLIHPKFILQEAFTDSSGNKHRAVTFTPDFQYHDNAQNKVIVEDVKAEVWYKTKKLGIKKKKFLVTTDYALRKTLFLKAMPQDMIFMEIASGR